MRYKDWIAKLTTIGFLREPLTYAGGKIYSLTTPIVIRFPKQAVGKILTGYNAKFEVGGVVLAVPKLEDGNRILEVKKIILLKNLSSTPEKSFFRPKIKSDIHKIWKSSLDIDKKFYIPIFFHSHPRIKSSYIVDVNKLVGELSPVATSEADRKFSLGLQIPINSVKFLVPNALVVRSEIAGQQTIIGFFGGGITPTDFTKYFAKLTGKTVGEIRNALDSWIKEDPNRIWLLILLGLLIAIPIVLYPKKVIPIILVLTIILLGSQIIPITRQVADNLPNYLGVLRKEGTMIRIPKYIT